MNINAIISIGNSFIAEQRAITESVKDKAIQDYITALDMPRKKKKKAKKSALLLYSIACHSEDMFKL